MATATNGMKRIVIEPVTRVEGHGKVTILLDEKNRVQQSRLHPELPRRRGGQGDYFFRFSHFNTVFSY